MNKIIAVVGMCGSGKSVAVEEFIKRGWNHVYFGAATMNILKERNLPINEENERKVREELRASGDKGIYAKMGQMLHTALQYPHIFESLWKNGFLQRHRIFWLHLSYMHITAIHTNL